jgi:hypothetical protein
MGFTDSDTWDFKITTRDNIVMILIAAPSEQQADILFHHISHDITENNKIELEIVGEKTIITDGRRGTTLQ